MTVQLVQRAYKFALSPTRRLERAFSSHAGGARFAYNWGVDRVAQALDAYAAEAEAGVPEAQRTKRPKHFDLCKMWTAYKDAHATVPDERGRTAAWVGENFVGTYQAALRDAAGAWDKFFDSRAGRRAGRRVGRPRYKSRHRTPPAFQVHGTSVRMVDKSHINLPKIGVVAIPGKIRIGSLAGSGLVIPDNKAPGQAPNGRATRRPAWEDRNGRIARSLARALRKPGVACPTCAAGGKVEKPAKLAKDGTVLKPAELVDCGTCKGAGAAPSARIIRATISRGASGAWWCSVTAEVAMNLPDGPSRRQRDNGAVGLDLGTRYVAVDSDGTIFANPQHLEQALAELKVAQRALSRTAKDSRRREKARRRVGAIHERVALMRKDSADRVTSRIARTFACVAVEGWDAQQVAEKGDPEVPKRIRKRRNRQLADAAPGMMRWQLEYKTSWRGAAFFKADRHQETGRTCSVCGRVRTKPVPLDDEMFRCENPACLAVLDRRVNSARVVRGQAGEAGRPGGPSGPPSKPRGGDVRPEAPRRGGHSPMKRAARSRSPDRPQTGTAAPEGAAIPSTALTTP